MKKCEKSTHDPQNYTTKTVQLPGLEIVIHRPQLTESQRMQRHIEVQRALAGLKSVL